MRRLYSLLLGLAVVGQACWAEDLLDNADLAPGNDLGEPVIIRLLPASAGQAAVIEQQGAGNRAALDQNGQALLGLVTNAAQAAPERGRVTVEAVREGTEVTLAVEDDGPGVPESERERIFEPFYSTRSDGHGLGLAVVRQIARAHGARLEVSSNGGAGARFSITLPLAHGVAR